MNNQKVNKKFEIGDFYTVYGVQTLLGFTYVDTLILFRNNLFSNEKLGSMYMVDKKTFEQWAKKNNYDLKFEALKSVTLNEI